MSEKNTVTLIRKQATDYEVNYPYGDNGRPRTFMFVGAKGSRYTEKEIPIEVFNWLYYDTACIKSGDLIIKEEDIEEVEDVKQALEDIEDYSKISQSVLSREEVRALLETGNHNTLKKALKELIADKPETLIATIKHSVSMNAQEIGIDSVAKRKVLCSFLDIDYDMSEGIFNKDEN